MTARTYNREFWHWYLKETFQDFSGITLHQDIIKNYENVFKQNGEFDLTIDLTEGVCIDSNQARHRLTEFVALKMDEPINDTEHRLDIGFARWETIVEEKQKNQNYKRDVKNKCWLKKGKKDQYMPVTEFDIVVTSVIEKYNLKMDKWERYYEAELRFNKYGRPQCKEIKLSPDETHSTSEFSKAVWQKSELEVINLKRNEDMRNFWVNVVDYYEPRIVREYEYYGFIEFEEEKFFLGENVLIRFPDHPNKKLELIAANDGAFPVEENKFIKPPEDAIYLSHFELGFAQNGYFQDKMNQLLSDTAFEQQLDKVEMHFCSMIGDREEFGQWGKLIIAYIFSFIFFEEIYQNFNHVIYLYFYGEGNVGKGEMVHRILDFYGLNYLDSLNTPKARSVDEGLEQKSRIPLWIDEHVPEVPGKDANIEDQIWNSWFELKMRRTNMPKGNSWGLERKAIRTMPVFCSNFKPRTDHLLSRCIIVEYKKEYRGPERHVSWLKNRKELLQLLMLSFMQNYKLINRQAFKWDLEQLRSKMKEEIKAEMEERCNNAILQDRQINQFATLIVVYHWLRANYRHEISRLSLKDQQANKETDKMYSKVLRQQIETEVEELIDQPLYQFAKDQIIRQAVTAAERDPLTEYLETISTLIESRKINESHFHWMKDGTLKFWAKAVWDKYVDAKRGTDEMVRREVVEKKLKEMSDLTTSGGLKIVNWTPKGAAKQTSQRGFYIQGANKNKLLREGFQLHNYGPTEAKLNGKEMRVDDGEPEFKLENVDIADDAPF